MFRFIPTQAALTDLADDVVLHATGIAQGLFDLVTVVALGLAIYATGVDHAAGGLPVSTLQASVAATVTSQGLCDKTSDTCITAMVLKPLES